MRELDLNEINIQFRIHFPFWTGWKFGFEHPCTDYWNLKFGPFQIEISKW